MKKIYLLLVTICLIIVSCEDGDQNDSNGSGTDGQGGSLATFALKGDYLYVVDNTYLNVFNISTPESPVQVNREYIGFEIETLFGFKDYLYIGSRRGMFIYSLEKPEFPVELSSVEHFTACDPVVANDTHAYVTLHSVRDCTTGNLNVLEIYDIQNITEPVLISTRNLIQPKGLGLYGNYVIVCDDEIKIFDISDPKESKLVNTIDKEAFDVIIKDDMLIAIGRQGVYQYSLENKINGVQYSELSSIYF